MKLLYISMYFFEERRDGVYALPTQNDAFFQKYLNVFSEIKVLGEKIKGYLDASKLARITDPRISVRIIKSNTYPKDFINDREIKRILTEEIKEAEAIVVKPSSRKGMMAIKIAERLGKPYMIEMTGDIHNAMRRHPNFLKRCYAPILYRQICRAIKNCQFGLYVSEQYLQKQFPIPGKTCGCTDAVLDRLDDSVLARRLQKIESFDFNRNRIDIALIGFYQGKLKGVDIAIRALSKLPGNFHLSILGNGTEVNRLVWIKYGESFGVVNRIHFPEPLPNSKEVARWLDGVDFFVLPSRSEGFPRCLVEALSRGCPSFATNICAMPEMLPSECLHALGDAAALAQKIEWFAHNKEAMRNLAIRNFQKAQEYDFELLRERRDRFFEEFKNYASKILTR